MKVVFLNTWQGKRRSQITEYLHELVPDTDVFCFQEMYGEMPAVCDEVLTNYRVFRAHKVVTEVDQCWQATYVKNGLQVTGHGELMPSGLDVGLGLYVVIQVGSELVNVCNFHGLSRPVDKLDNPGRLKQSQTLIDFFRDKQGMQVIGGDFNAFPENKCIEMFEQAGYRNLIRDFKIETTRNEFVWNRYPVKHLHSDYVFLNKVTSLRGFAVPNVKVSDHLPLIVDVELAKVVTKPATATGSLAAAKR